MKPNNSAILRTTAVLCIITIMFANAGAAGGSHQKRSGSTFNKVSMGTSDDVVLEWNETATDATLGNPPFPSARWMAIVQLAVFEAVNSVTGKYDPYLGTLFPSPNASIDAAVAQQPVVHGDG